MSDPPPPNPTPTLEQVLAAMAEYQRAIEAVLRIYDARAEAGIGGNLDARVQQAEMRRMAYEQRRSSYEAQERRTEARAAAQLAKANLEVAREQAIAATQSVTYVEKATAAAVAQAVAAAEGVRQAEAATKAAQVQASAAEVQRKVGLASIAVSAIVSVAIIVQTCFLVAQYRLQKWQVDHPVPPVACVR